MQGPDSWSCFACHNSPQEHLARASVGQLSQWMVNLRKHQSKQNQFLWIESFMNNRWHKRFARSSAVESSWSILYQWRHQPMSNSSYKWKASRIGPSLHPPHRVNIYDACKQQSHTSHIQVVTPIQALSLRTLSYNDQSQNAQAGTGGNIQPRRRQVTFLYSSTACNKRPWLEYQVSQPAQFLHCKLCQRCKTRRNVNDKRLAKMFIKLIATKNSLLYTASVKKRGKKKLNKTSMHIQTSHGRAKSVSLRYKKTLLTGI